MSLQFPKSHRLLRRSQFLRFSKNGKERRGKCVVISVLPNRAQKARLGITVTKRFGKAFQRNRFKRVVREAFRQLYPSLSTGVDVHIRPRKKARYASVHHVIADFKDHLL